LLLLARYLRLDPTAAAAETVALWLFDERPGIYPSSVLADAGPNGYPLVLGRGARMTEGRFGHALEACDPIPIDIQGRSKSVLFGLTPAPTLPGRTVPPMTWQTAHFCGLATAGERHLRRMEFVNPTESGLNLGAHDWTIEFWFKPAADPKGPGVVFEIGEGPRGENDHVTRLTLDCSQARFVLVNQPAAIELPLPSTPTAFPPAARAWHHFAFVYSAAAEQLHHYVDGTLQPLPGKARIQPLPRGEEAYCSVGRDALWQQPLPGAIDELRFSRGQVYTADFEPPGSFSTTYRGTRSPPELEAGPPLLFGATTTSSGPLNLGPRKHLFLDDALLQTKENIAFTVNPPRFAEKVLEGIAGHLTVVEDGLGLIRLYGQGPRDSLAVWVSRDGVHWDKPDLGRGEFPGERNVVIREPVGLGTVFIDPNGPATERWKYVSGVRHQGLFVYTSVDGWSFRRHETAALPFDMGSQVITFYDDQRRTYVSHLRSDYGATPSGHTERRFLLAEVTNLLQAWPFEPVTPARTREVGRTLPIQNEQLDPWFLDNGPLCPAGLGIEYPVGFGPDPKLDPVATDIYVPKTLKYPAAPDAYLAFPVVYFHYHDDGPPARRELGRRERGRGSGATETQLAASRDGLAWRRYPRPAYVGNGRHEGMDIHMAYIAQGMALRGEEIWQYYLGSAFYHSPWKDGNRAVFRLVQRRDGFVSADAPYTGGRLVTKPLRFAGDRLVLNIDTDAAGYAQVGLLDDAGKPIPGFGIEDCIYLNGDFIEAEVEWLGKGKDLGSLAGRTVQVEIEMHGAKLYALQFKTANEPAQTDPAASVTSALARRPRVLLLGDSISIGYAPAVRDLLRGKADICHPCDTVESNCESTRKGLERLDVWLGYQAWDVIHFNFGLHDLKYVDERGAMVAVDRGRQLTPLDQYEHNLRTLVDRLKQTGAKLIFATTTPVPPGAHGRVAGDETRYNEAAIRVMTEAGIFINDLHALAQPRLAEIQRPANVHFTADGSRELARAVVDTIERELAR
jgi:lysophospholipase L1-like esterase